MTSLGKYELHEQLGRGGFGTVYRAVDTTLNRDVALKVLHPQLTTDPDFLRRFQNEARVVASLKSQYVVTIHELAELDGRVFIAMEYLPGGSLKDRLEKSGGIPFKKTLEIMKEVCAGIQEAHDQGMVHRDVKPANILFDKKGLAVIGDFGLARAVQMSGSSTSSSSGIGAGTPAYRAPELWRGKPPAGPATDVYSLGCVLYEMLTGKVLFDGSTPDEFLTQHILEGPALPESLPAGVPSEVRAVLEKALAREQEKRYQDVRAFLAALGECGREPAISKPREEKNEKTARPSEPKPGRPPPPNIPGQKPRKKFGIIAFLAAAVLGLGICLGGLISPPPAEPAIPPTQEPAAAPIMAPTRESTTEPTLAPSQEPITLPTLGIGSTRVSEIDGMEMVFVPPGEFLMGSSEGIGVTTEYPQHRIYLGGFWIDRTEVTNGMYQKCVAAGVCSRPREKTSKTHESYYDNSSYAEYPVILVNWEQANAYCKWAGRFLPNEKQWEKAARGTDGRTYPWGNSEPERSLVNFASNNGDTTAVGSYPAGVSPYGAFDMAGNVWEWTSDWYDVYPGGVQKASEYFGATLKTLRGGSWENPSFNIRSAVRGGDDPSVSYDNLGFRCAISSDTNEKVVPNPTPSASANLGIGSTRFSEVDGMEMVYVPAGEFLMGSPEGVGAADEHPQHTVYLDSYWIDKTEITNRMYQYCVLEGGCTEPYDLSSSNRKSYYDNTDYSNFPVINVSWKKASAYCKWAGRNLPTEAQWEKAARGFDGRIYPWGDEKPDQNFENFNGNINDTTQVGSYPEATSPYGALDLAGNVWEWTADWYDNSYYSDSPTRNPIGPISGEYRTLRGGSWLNNRLITRSAYRFWESPFTADSTYGFRCVLEESR